MKDHWSYKSLEIISNFFRALVNTKNSKKKISDVCDIDQLREARYWFNIAKYERKQVNKSLSNNPYFYENQQN